MAVGAVDLSGVYRTESVPLHIKVLLIRRETFVRGCEGVPRHPASSAMSLNLTPSNRLRRGVETGLSGSR